MKKLILISAVSLLTLMACRKDDFTWKHDHFSFLTKTMEVSVKEDTEFFIFKGIMSSKLERDRVAKIRVLNERTTAIKGTHYEFTDDTLMHFPANTKECEMKVKLVRGSITTPLDLTLYHFFYDPEKDMSKHIDTITVKLIPVKKE